MTSPPQGFQVGLAGALIAPAGPSISKPEELRLMVSCGSYQDDLRTIAERAIDLLGHRLRWDSLIPHNVVYWDYRRDMSRDEEVDHLADRSLRAVAESDGIVGILGGLVPPTTRLEIREVYELSLRGQPRELLVFLDNRPGKTEVEPNPSGFITRKEFLEEIKRDYGKERLCTPSSSELDFQAALLTQLFPFLVKRAGTAFGPLDK